LTYKNIEFIPWLKNAGLTKLRNCGIVNLFFPPPAIFEPGNDEVDIELTALAHTG
jgi:hypothetical protein